MYTVSIALKGTCPIFFNQWTKKALSSLEGTGGRGGKLTLHDKQVEAPEKAYKNPQTGCYYIPGKMLKSSIVAGAGMANLKVQRRSLSKYLKAVMFVADAPFLDGKTGTQGVLEIPYLDERVIPTSNGADIQVRPAFGKHNFINLDGELEADAPWYASTTLTVGDDSIDYADLCTAVQTAGLYCAIGSHRPEYGRFQVEDFSKPKYSKTDQI